MSGSRQMVDVLNFYSGGCEALSEALRSEPITSQGVAPSVLDKHGMLARAIEVEIIPRLMLAHRQVRSHSKASGKPLPLTDDDVAEFARIAVKHDATVAHAFVEAVSAQGMQVEQIFMDLFAPAARRLGKLWEDDRFSFTDVTIGLSRIQQLIHEFSPFYEPEEEQRFGAYSTVLVTMPGEQHSLGLLLVEEFFRRAGWSVWTPQNISIDQLVSIVRQERFDMVGISVTCEVELERLKKLIQSVRAASANREVLVMIGGRFINEHPDYVAKSGADATDFDGSQAVRRLEALSSRLRTS